MRGENPLATTTTRTTTTLGCSLASFGAREEEEEEEEAFWKLHEGIHLAMRAISSGIGEKWSYF